MVAFVQEGEEGLDPHHHWVEAGQNPSRVFHQLSKLREVLVMNVSSHLPLHHQFLLDFLQHVLLAPAGIVDLALPAHPHLQLLQIVL